jgi:hypothetical protein
MTKQENILKQLNPQYFWDVDFSKLDPLKSKRLLVERVIALGSSKEIHALIDYYGKAEVIKVVTSLNYIDPKTLNFVALYFNTPLKSFKCYIRKQLTKQHWNS